MSSETKLEDEAGRLYALERYEVLDTQEERPFENVVNLVQQTLQVPMCAVSLIDRHRQWFKAQRGLGVRETARDISFCTHAIKQTEAFVVTNALEHPTLSRSPLVTSAPNIRAYAGIPLETPDGYNIGTLCAIDDKPRDFLPHEIEILRNFAKIVVNELELRQIASCDGLTGALCRRAWVETANREIERAVRYGRALSLAILDIDKFKSVNDTHGHPAGDRVIQALAAQCMETMRQSDYFGRLGGEEFVLLMIECTGQDGLTCAERLRETFAGTPIDIGDEKRITCTFSAGVAELSGHETLDALMARADRSLYEAKAGGRNRTVVDTTVPPGS